MMKPTCTESDEENILKLPFDIWQIVIKKLSYIDYTHIIRVSKGFTFLIPEKSIPQMQYKKEVGVQIIHLSKLGMASDEEVSHLILRYNRDKAKQIGVRKPPGGYYSNFFIRHKIRPRILHYGSGSMIQMIST